MTHFNEIRIFSGPTQKRQKIGNCLITIGANISLVIGKDGTAVEWALETLLKTAFKPNKITAASRLVRVLSLPI
jgi:hypothetical protein